MAGLGGFRVNLKCYMLITTSVVSPGPAQRPSTSSPPSIPLFCFGLDRHNLALSSPCGRVFSANIHIRERPAAGSGPYLLCGKRAECLQCIPTRGGGIGRKEPRRSHGYSRRDIKEFRVESGYAGIRIFSCRHPPYRQKCLRDPSCSTRRRHGGCGTRSFLEEHGKQTEPTWRCPSPNARTIL